MKTNTANFAARSVDEQAAYWVMMHLDGPLPEEQERAFTEWLAEDAHREAFEALERADASLSVSGEDLLAQSFEEELWALDAEQQRQSWRLPGFAALAATLVLALGAVFVLDPFASPERAVYATGVGGAQKVTLEDGSLVTMNAASALDVLLSADERHVELSQGEAFFSVAREADRAFRVETDHGAVVVTGTKFNVKTHHGETAVSVVSGSVDVTPEGGMTRTLLAGDRIVFGPSYAEAVLESFDPAVVLAWRQGHLVFRGTPLFEVVEELNHHFERPIVLSDDAPLHAPVDGTFATDDPQLAIRGLTVALSLEAVSRPGGVLLRPEAVE